MSEEKTITKDGSFINSNFSDLYKEKEEKDPHLSELSKEDLKENTKKDDDDIEWNETFIIYCKCCSSTIKIKFISKELVNVKCNKYWKIMNVENFNIKYLNLIRNINPTINNLQCTKHNNKFVQYCQNCKKNKCLDCNIENNCQEHTHISFSTEKIAKLNTYIHQNDYKNDFSEISFCKLLKFLIITHEEYPNIKTFQSIESASLLLDLIEQGKKENESIQKKEGKFVTNFKEIYKDDVQGIYSIYLDNENFRNIKYLYKQIIKRNTNLLKLTLSGNNITNIKFLSWANLNLLKHLDLSRNKLGNINIKYLNDLNCRSLKRLYIHQNMFNDYILLNVVSDKFNLEIFYVGFNRLEQNIDKLKACNFPNLKEFGINYIFGKYTTKNKEIKDSFEKLKEFKIPNLENLYAQNNDINSLSLFDKMQLQKLKELYLNKNELKEIDINTVTKFPNLERISFNFNSISKINNINKIKDLKNLKKFSIENNRLDSETKKILKDIEKEIKN